MENNKILIISLICFWKDIGRWTQPDYHKQWKKWTKFRVVGGPTIEVTERLLESFSLHALQIPKGLSESCFIQESGLRHQFFFFTWFSRGQAIFHVNQLKCLGSKV